MNAHVSSGSGLRYEADDPAVPVVPLRQMLWRSYLRTALIPLLFIELGFLATYWISATVVYEENVDAVSDLSRRYAADIAKREAGAISTRLEAVASHTRVFAQLALDALEGNYSPPDSERDRYSTTADGVLYTTRDNGTTASFYSNRHPIRLRQVNKVWRLSALDPFMISTAHSNELIASIYFNSYDSYNRIYPYFDVLAQYPHDMDIARYNFFYEADEAHNPERRDVWTDAYIDPAGHGWMVSSIAPVWRNERLEGVVGIDLTLETLIENVLGLDLPWGGYAVLVDESGGIIALPPSGEDDFGLTEMTDHNYAEAIRADTFKPDKFNIFRRGDTQSLAEAISASPSGEVDLDLGGPRSVSFDTIPQTGWKLLIIAPTDQILTDARSLNNRLKVVGLVMLGVLFLFYILFFSFLLMRARKMSQLIATPIGEIAGLIDCIGSSGIAPTFKGSHIQELDNLGRALIVTDRRLLAAEEESRFQSKVAHDALTQLQAANTQMVNFTRQMSHQIRTPLSIIDGGAQILLRKADTTTPTDLRKRASLFRRTVKTIEELLDRLTARFDAITGELATGAGKIIDLNEEIEIIAKGMVGAARLHLELPPQGSGRMLGAAPLLIALREVLDNMQTSAPQDYHIYVALNVRGLEAIVTVDAAVPDHPSRSVSTPCNGKDYHAPANSQIPSLEQHIARKAVEDYGGTFTVAFDEARIKVTMTIPVIEAPDNVHE